MHHHLSSEEAGNAPQQLQIMVRHAALDSDEADKLKQHGEEHHDANEPVPCLRHRALSVADAVHASTL